MGARARYVGLIGSGEGTPRELELASAVGAALAREGATIVCGGLGGVMEAACRGARQEGGLTVGVLPGEDRECANEHVEVALPSGLGELRNGLIVRFSDAVIAIGGGWGTLSEIAFAMRTGRPVVALASWEEALSGPGARAQGVLQRAEDPEQAVALALAAAASARAGSAEDGVAGET